MDHSRSSYTDLLPFEPHSAIICGQTSCGKTVFVLDLFETQYRGHFDHIVMLFCTVKYNKAYNDREWLHINEEVYLVDLGDQLNDYLHAFCSLFAGKLTLYIIDDCSATKALTKKKDMLSELVFSGRDMGFSCWILSKKFNNVLMYYREQTQWIILFHCKDHDSYDEVLKENDVIPKEQNNAVRKVLAKTKHAKLIIKTTQPASYAVVA